VANRDSARSGSIFVLAGCNGAGKSTIGGAALRQSGFDFFNPDEAARRMAAANASATRPLTQAEINAAAWNEGRRLLLRTIEARGTFAFETTLGGTTMTRLLVRAATAGMAVHVWFAGLVSVELHVDRVRRRVARGGHDIPAETIRRRFVSGRANLIRLLPYLTELYLYDNSIEGDPESGVAPAPRLLMHCRARRITQPIDLQTLLVTTPAWAKPIVAAAVKLHLRAQAGQP
jgi:predicted ABC-type ATPase